MKVLLLTDADVFAGTERHIFDLACALRDQKIEVRVACPVPSPLAARCGESAIRVLDLPKRGFVDWQAARILRRELKSRRVDVLHAHNGRTALAGALAVFLARRGTLVATQHFLAPNRTTQTGVKARLFGLAHGWVGRQTRATIAISRAVRDAMIARGEDENKICVVPNGIPDVAQHSANRVLEGKPNTRVEHDVRAELGIGAAPLVLCAARLEREKDIASLVEAMKFVVEKVPHARCAVAGEGALRDALQRQIEALQLNDNVRLLGFRRDVWDLMRACDVFVLPSLAEPFGLVLIEAMAWSKPVIATDEGGPREIVASGVSGFLVPPSSPRALSQALLQLLGDDNLRNEMGRAARARYDELFTAERMAREIAEVYRRAQNLSESGCGSSFSTP